MFDPLHASGGLVVLTRSVRVTGYYAAWLRNRLDDEWHIERLVCTLSVTVIQFTISEHLCHTHHIIATRAFSNAVD